jgi:tetratricopeptide (TPR) repeat protein
VTDQTKTIDVASIQQLMASNNFEQALVQLESHLEQSTDDHDALYMAAVCYRYIKAAEQAQTLLHRLLTLKPDNGRAHQEQGHLLLACNKPQEALLAFVRACKFNSALTASWQAQVKLFTAQGNHQAAAQAKFELDRIQAMPKHLIAATDLLAEGKIVKAENLCRKFLQHAPKNVEAMG